MMGVADTLLAALSGSLHPAVPAEHPVTAPDFAVKYEQKDITADIAPYLVSFSYTDYLGGQSDELQLDFEDTDGRWLRTWYPEQGDTVSLSCGDQFTGQVSWGSFEIAEIEWQRSVRGGDTVSLKALSTGITKSNRTLKAKAYENTTLAAIVRLVAKRLHLSVSGTVADIPIRRVTQYQERDVEFLTRLAAEYGHTFKIVGNTLVFESRETLAERDAAAVLLPENLTQIRLRDNIKNVPESVEVSSFDHRAKKTVRSSRKTRPRRKPRRTGKRQATTNDTLKIVARSGENQAQLDRRAQSALDNAQDDKCAGSITLYGNALLVAGQTVELARMGHFSGRYLVKQARHDYSRLRGYTTELEVKMIEYIPEGGEQEERQDAQAARNP